MMTDGWLTTLSFLGCNEWQQLIYTCKALSKLLKCRFLKYIKLFAISRLEKMLGFLDFSHFMNLIRCEGGQIAGSIHVQLVTTNFHAHDIDIFVYGNRSPEFSPLHKYLFSICKTVESVLYNFRHSNPTAVYQDAGCFHDDRVSNEYRLRHAYKVLSVWNYHFHNNITLQVITIYNDKDSFMLLDKRIQNDIGDFTITQSTFNGINYFLSGIKDIFNSRLQPTENFLIRASLFKSKDITKHKHRVKKYEIRGFTLTRNIQYGTNVAIFKINNDNWQESYISLLRIPSFIKKRKHELISKNIQGN